MSDDTNRFEGRGSDVGFGSATGIPGSTLTGRTDADTGYDRERDPEFAADDGVAPRAADLDADRDVMDDDDDIDAEVSHNPLISSERVTGTAVYNATGEHLGTIESVMIDKVSGEVAYAVLSFGGFLGIGERYHPLPWESLTYDEALGGYSIDETVDRLKAGPNYSREELETLDYDDGGIDDYYGAADSADAPMRM